MRILVTGGSGFLGTHVRRLLNADDFSRRVGLDVLNLSDVQMAADYDVVVHLAAHLDKSPESADACFLTNIEGTVNLLRVMSPNSVFIFASTKDVYGVFADDFDEVPETCPTDFCGQSALEWSKLIAERYIDFYAAARGFRGCIFRLSTVYAPASIGNEPNFVTHYLDAVQNELPIRLPLDGTPRRDLLHVEDFAAACRAFIDSDVQNGLYNLGGGRENVVTLRELLDKFQVLTGKNAIVEAGSGVPVPRNYVSDLSKIEHELDWRPIVDIDTGLNELFADSEDQTD